jgi:hypothetical protein
VRGKWREAGRLIMHKGRACLLKSGQTLLSSLRCSRCRCQGRGAVVERGVAGGGADDHAAARGRALRERRGAETVSRGRRCNWRVAADAAASDGRARSPGGALSHCISCPRATMASVRLSDFRASGQSVHMAAAALPSMHAIGHERKAVYGGSKAKGAPVSVSRNSGCRDRTAPAMPCSRSLQSAVWARQHKYLHVMSREGYDQG